LSRVIPSKDVDGVHPYNMGQLALGARGGLEACTPKGCMLMLSSIGLSDLSGLRAVVVGRSNIVGRPMSLMLLRAHATVTVCHSRSSVAVLESAVRHADIVVAACGRPGLIRGEWLKSGAIVLDVGTNAVEDASIPKGYRLVGDVDHASAVEHAGWLSPVPGGVGPMTIAMLLDNTLHAATTALQVLPVQGGVSHGATVQVQPHNDAL
jgi:5,10-methylene-tetrahydrofolate dehydrogenase/methenyl tetrahydrofolate cyclohydrolase